MEDLCLYELSDDLGVDGEALRRGLVGLIATQLASITTEAPLVLKVLGLSGTVKLPNGTLQDGSAAAFSEFVAASGFTVGANSVVRLTFDSSQYGAQPQYRGEPGLRVAVSGVGSDDDVVLMMQGAGYLPDGQLDSVPVQGEHVVQLPMGAVSSSAINWTLVNASETPIAVYYEGRAVPVTPSASKGGRAHMRKQRKPVGAARMARLSGVLDVAEETAKGAHIDATSRDGSTQARPRARGLAAVGRLVAQGGLKLAFERARSALKGR